MVVEKCSLFHPRTKFSCIIHPETVTGITLRRDSGHIPREANLAIMTHRN